MDNQDDIMIIDSVDEDGDVIMQDNNIQFQNFNNNYNDDMDIG